MRDKQNMEKKVEEALNSLDGMERATPGPFFFTRVQARLQREDGSAWDQTLSFITRPAVALAGLCLVVLLNAAAFYLQPGAGNTIAVNGNPGEPSYAEEYNNLAANSYFYDENPESDDPSKK